MMLCIVIKGPSIQEAREQLSNSLAYADLVELRLDYFSSLNLCDLRDLRNQFILPMIFTLKGKAVEKETLFSLLSLKPDYVDLDALLPSCLIKEIFFQHPEIKLILSYHNFTETPEDLEKIYQNMQKVPAYFYKLAVTAQHSSDVLKFICWTKSNPNSIPVSMGHHGQLSRIIGPVMKWPITYASLDDHQSSAPGQLSAEMLIKKYHYRDLNPTTALYGLIGDPVHLSISDETHNAFFHAYGLNAVYVKMQVAYPELFSFLEWAKKLPFSGLSVTMPLKEQMMDFLDEIDPEAAEIGAVNTLLFKDHRIIGFNTDGVGALNAIEKECRVKDKQMILIGAGGASKAIAYEAIRRGAHVTILNRNKEKAIEMAHRLKCIGKGLEEMSFCWKAGYDILINCTSITCPISSDFFIPGTLIMDIKTTLKESLFLKEAREKGCQVRDGNQMFIEQAIGQFHLWFKDRLDVQKSRAILEKKVANLSLSREDRH